MLPVAVTLLFFVIISCSTSSAPVLDIELPDYLKKAHLTQLNIQTNTDDHRRVKRMLATGRDHPEVEVSFAAFNRQLTLVLDNKRLFTTDPLVTVYTSKTQATTIPLDTDDYLQGHLKGDDNSYAHGRLLEHGQFDGAVVSPFWNDSFYIEPAQRYFQNANGSLVYRFSDLDQSSLTNVKGKCKGVHPQLHGMNAHDKRLRRSFETSELVSPKRLPSMHCPLHVFVDHRYFEDVGRGNIAGTIAELIYHIGQADSIFRSTAFDGRVTGSNIGFSIAKITLWKTADSNPISHVEDGADAQDYLSTFTQIDHTQFCLGVAFTVVDFMDGVLGLAWIADPRRNNAGICAEPYKYRNSTSASFNSAIISMKNFKTMISRPMFSITVTHELGHNFGSEHDNGTQYACAPGGFDGNFIMFHVSGDGLKPNHFLFSSCSVNYMYNVLLTRMELCFQAVQLSYCSNAIIDEEKEECDCGTESTCDEFDQCCTVYTHNSTSQCTLKPTSTCSPVASVCCSDTCEITPASERRLCLIASECQEKSYCDGMHADCPIPANLPDGTLCQNNVQVCYQGECGQSVCTFHGYVDCYCTDARYDCHLCCMENQTKSCQPAYMFGIQAGINGGRIPTNGLCMDGRGICDVDGICIFLDGTFAKADISELVKQTASRALSVVTNYWYFILLGVAAASGVTLMFVVIHKSKKPMHSIAYRDGRMARIWFEVKERLALVEKQIEALDDYDPSHTTPFIVASRRLAFQFPSAPQHLYNELVTQCSTEMDAVKIMLLSGYPIRRLFKVNE